MKRLIITALASVALLFAMVSCSKDYISPEELFSDGSKVAKTTIQTKSSDYEDTVTTFNDPTVYRKNGEEEGQSWFVAWSGGRMVYDMFMLSIFFDSIDNMEVGDKLHITHFMFAFPASSDSRAYTSTYSGKITLADKGEDYVILQFHKVSVSCLYGKYVTDGYLYCTLKDEPKLSY